MEQLDCKRIVNNIYSKAKELDIKIGDIEKDIPVSLGYFSRFLKEDNHSLPSFESLYVAAIKLRVTIDSLISSNYDSMNEEEFLLQEKILLLISNTNEDRYSWKEIRKKDFYQEINPDHDGICHPRYGFDSLDIHRNANGKVEYATPVYFSSFIENKAALKGSIFALNIDTHKFYVSYIQEIVSKTIYYEFYVTSNLTNNMTLYKLVNASENDRFYKLLNDLYSTCVLKSQEFKLNTFAKNALKHII